MGWPPKLLAIYSDVRQNHLSLFKTKAILVNLLGRLDDEARSLALAQSTAKSKTAQNGIPKKLSKANIFYWLLFSSYL